MNQPRISTVQRSPTAALDPELEAIALQLSRMPPEDATMALQQFVEENGGPTDGNIYNAMALAKAAGIPAPFGRSTGGPSPEAMGAGGAPGGPMRPMSRGDSPDYSGFQEGPHDPWRGQRGGMAKGRRKSLFDGMGGGNP